MNPRRAGSATLGPSALRPRGPPGASASLSSISQPLYTDALVHPEEGTTHIPDLPLSARTSNVSTRMSLPSRYSIGSVESDQDIIQSAHCLTIQRCYALRLASLHDSTLHSSARRCTFPRVTCSVDAGFTCASSNSMHTMCNVQSHTNQQLRRSFPAAIIAVWNAHQLPCSYAGLQGQLSEMSGELDAVRFHLLVYYSHYDDEQKQYFCQASSEQRCACVVPHGIFVHTVCVSASQSLQRTRAESKAVCFQVRRQHAALESVAQSKDSENTTVRASTSAYSKAVVTSVKELHRQRQAIDHMKDELDRKDQVIVRIVTHGAKIACARPTACAAAPACAIIKRPTTFVVTLICF